MLRAVLPADIRRQVVGDLDEEFARRVSSGSGARARLWYWRQAVISLPFAWQMRRRSRLRSRGGGPPRAFRLADAARDLRHGFRLIRRQPLLALSVTLTLALGIGAATSVFTMTHAVLLRGLPYADADRLVSVGEFDSRRAPSGGNVSWPDFLDYRAQSTALAGLAGHSGGSRTLIGAGPPDRVAMTEVTPGFFAMLGVQPALGRDFVDTDFEPGASTPMILSDRAWRLRFGGDPAALGLRVDLGGAPATIVGVLPPSFEFPLRGLTELWLPVRPSQAQRERRYFHWLTMVGRLKPDVTLHQAAADLRSIAARFAALDPQWHPAASVRLRTLSDQIVGRLRPTVLVLAGAAVVLLVVACANVAALLLTRGLGRAHDIGVRSSIGASPGRLVRQLLAETMALAVPGMALGVAGGYAALRAFIAMLPLAQRVSLPHLDQVGLHPMMLLASTGLALAATLGCGLAPAWQAARQGAEAGAFRARAAAPRETRLHGAFVAAQIALTFVLVAGAALLGRSMYGLLAVSPGFDPEGLLTFRVVLGPRQATADATRAFHAEALQRLRAMPGSEGAATINQLPLTGPGNSGTFKVFGASDALDHEVLIRTVSDGYFDLLRLSPSRGRVFQDTDSSTAPRVVVVNRLAADTIFGGEAVGKRIAFPFFDGQPWWDIVGVVGNEQFDALDRAMRPVVYFPYAQTPDGGFSALVRVAGDPLSVEPAVRRVIADLDPALPVFQVRPLTRIVEESDAVFRRRAALIVVGGFALAALSLAAVGLYGAVAQMVSRRTREIGIRQALGATRGNVIGVTLGRGLAPAAVGLVAGLAASLAVAPSLRSLVFGVGASDPLTLAGVVAFLFVVAVVAAYLPARRALRIDAVKALKD